MSAPTVIQVKKLEETVAGTGHAFPAFSDVQAGDVIYWVGCVEQTPNISVMSGGTLSSWPIRDPNGQRGTNHTMTIVRGLIRSADGTEENFPITLTTGASRLVAGVAIQVRGASSTPVAGTDEQFPQWLPTNPGDYVAPGVSAGVTNNLIPGSAAGAAGPASTVVAVFARLGNTTYNTGIVDPVGNGLAAGAPYVASRNCDFYPNLSVGHGGADGGNTAPFTKADHANSTDGTWKLQVGMAYRAVTTTDLQGNPNLDVAVGPGQIALSYWPINALGPAQPAALTAMLGIRVKGS